MKQKFIIMTTAIIRPILHNKSIGEFYNKCYIPYKEYIDNIYDIYHIINIDSPQKLCPFSSQEDTINNFNLIIPDPINRVYIPTQTPDFLQAFKNIMAKIEDLGLLNENNLYWWLEDDWEINRDSYSIFHVITHLSRFNKFSMTMTEKHPLGSFRGGPIMNHEYFVTHFNLYQQKIMNNTCDPEKQISKYITAKNGIRITKEHIKIRNLVHESDKHISIVLVYIGARFNKITADFNIKYYSDNFSNEICFSYHLIIIDDINKINDINQTDNLLYMRYDNTKEITNKNNYERLNIHAVIERINTHSITHIIVKPFIIADCGRCFAEEYGLIKSWTNYGDKITY